MIRIDKKKGFTLVELLAVIVILAIILVIAVPKVVNIINDSKKATFESSAKMIASQAEKQKIQNTILGNNETVTCDSVVKMNNTDYESCSIEFDENQALVTMTGSGKFEGYYICYGTKTGASVQEEPCGGEETIESCFLYENVYDVKVANKTSCMTYTRPIMVDLYGYTEDDLDTFCSGNIMDSMTFSQHINQMIYEEETTIDELIDNNVVTDVKEVVEVTGYDATCGTSVNVPRKIDNKLVYGIGYEAFVGTGITSVNLPTSLRYIGYGAFRSSGIANSYGTTTTPTDPYGTTTTPTDPYGTTTTPTDPYGTTTTPTEVSVNITGELDLSNLINLEVIGFNAFQDNQITSVKFPTSLESIGDYAFDDNQIKSIKFPSNLIYIGEYAFRNNGITGVLDLSNTKVTTIDHYAFAINKIENVKFPLSLLNIGNGAFATNEISETLDLSNTKITTINDAVFRSNSIASIKFPLGLKKIWRYAFEDNAISGTLDLSNTSVERIGNGAFGGNQIASLKLPLDIGEIEEGAFNTNLNLKTIINPSGQKFEWRDIVGVEIVESCYFETGTCGSISITAS